MVIEINGIQYPVVDVVDELDYKGRPCKTIYTNSLSYEELVNLFTEGVKWNYLILEEVANWNEELNEPVFTTSSYSVDCSMYSIPGVIKDYRNGTLSIDMCKVSVEDVLRMFEGVL